MRTVVPSDGGTGEQTTKGIGEARRGAGDPRRTVAIRRPCTRPGCDGVRPLRNPRLRGGHPLEDGLTRCAGRRRGPQHWSRQLRPPRASGVGIAISPTHSFAPFFRLRPLHPPRAKPSAHSPKLPLPIFFPIRYLLPTLRSTAISHAVLSLSFVCEGVSAWTRGVGDRRGRGPLTGEGGSPAAQREPRRVAR